MALAPVVRYMLLCDDWRLDGPNSRRVTIDGLIWNIHSLDDTPYPLFHREFCVFLVLTEGRGKGEGQIVIVLEDTGEKVFETPKWPIRFPPDPLEVVGQPVRIRDCTFPQAGRYSVQFWYNGVMLEERPLRLRRVMAGPGHNMEILVLDEYVCEAVHAPTIPTARPKSHGQNAGMLVVEEVVFEGEPEATVDDQAPPDDSRAPLVPERKAAAR